MNVARRALVAGMAFWLVAVFMVLGETIMELAGSSGVVGLKERLPLVVAYGCLGALAALVAFTAMSLFDLVLPALLSTAAGGLISYVVMTFAQAAVSGYGGGIVMSQSVFTIPFSLLLLVTVVATWDASWPSSEDNPRTLTLAELNETIARNKLAPTFLAVGVLWAFIPVVRGPESMPAIITISACSISLACLLMTASKYRATFRRRAALLVMISINILMIASTFRD